MDEQTRMARFESMKKTPGRHRVSRNKKLFMKHKELEKTCQKEIKRHEFDTRVATIDIKRQQIQVEKTQERLKTEQNKCLLSRQRTQMFLNEQDKIHERQQDRRIDTTPRVTERDIEKAVMDFHMPNRMRQRILQYL